VWGQWDGALGGETWDTARWPYPRTILARYEVMAQLGTPPRAVSAAPGGLPGAGRSGWTPG
jgi:hypothetical protein